MAATRRFSLRRVRLQHYRSIASCDVLLGPLTVLVGPNGAGKSNFLDSLPFVAQALDDNLDNALRERGGVTEVRRRSTGHPTHFVIDLSCEGDDFSARHAFKIAAVRGGDFKVSHESCRMPAPASDRLYLVSASGLAPFRALFDGLAAVRVYTLAPELMRKPQPPDAGDLLRRDGSNVASVLERLRREQPELKSRIEEYLRAIVPGVDSVDRRGLGSYESLEFRQQIAGASGSWTFPATSMSDGTLRALGVLVAPYGSSEDIHPPIGIEEPESRCTPQRRVCSSRPCPGRASVVRS